MDKVKIYKGCFYFLILFLFISRVIIIRKIVIGKYSKEIGERILKGAFKLLLSKEKKYMQKLPIGIQSFEKIRLGNYLYVDKTKQILQLIQNGECYFLSRPRRFGKSLTLSTLEAMFKGKAELFKGLYAENWVKEQAKHPNPVIKL